MWALLHHAISYKRKSQMPPGTSWTFPAHTPASTELPVFSPPGIHYPAKDARVRLCPLQRRIRAHPPWSHNKPPLSFPFLQSKVVFKRRNSLRFCLPNSEGPRGKGWENKAASSPGWVTSDYEEGAEGHGRQNPSPSQTAEKERGAAV